MNKFDCLLLRLNLIYFGERTFLADQPAFYPDYQ